MCKTALRLRVNGEMVGAGRAFRLGVERRASNSSGDWALTLAEVAQLYYLEDFTQERIARRFGFSRSRVSRMLKEARDLGLVEIHIRSPLKAADGVGRELGSRLGLRECLVLASSGRGASGDVRGNLGAFGARYLREKVADGDVVGVGWSSAVYDVVSSGHLLGKSGVTVVQLIGSLGGFVSDLDGASIIEGFAQALGGRQYFLQAPILVADAAVREGLLRDRHIARTLELARQADVTVVGVGTIDRFSGQYRAGYLDDGDLEYISGRGAIGEICGSYFSYDGSRVPLEMNGRTIGLGFEDLGRAPTRVAMGWGVRKALANIGAVRSGLANVLITDEDTAREMLDSLDGEPG